MSRRFFKNANHKILFFRVFLNAPLRILQQPKHQPHHNSVISQLNDITLRLQQQIERRERHNKSKYKMQTILDWRIIVLD